MDEKDLEIMLEGFSGIDRDTVKSYLQQIDINSITDPTTRQTIAPVIRRVYTLIFSPDCQFYRFKDNNILQGEIFSLVNVQSITKQLVEFNEYFLPIATTYLPHVDTQAEMTSLFCNNYMHGLLKEFYNKNN